MKSAVFYGKRDIRVEEREIPKAGEGEVVIKVMACGVCGSDVHLRIFPLKRGYSCLNCNSSLTF